MSILAVAEERLVKQGFIDVSPELLFRVLKLPAEGIVVDGALLAYDSNPLPEDSECLRCGITQQGNIRFVFTSDELPATLEGCPLPATVPTYRLTQPGDEETL